jgi:hypothetical protein
MKRGRAAGRLPKKVKEDHEVVGGAEVRERAEVKERTKAPRPASCRRFTRARVAEALPEIVERFALEAKRGSIAHAKVLMRMGGLDAKEEAPKGGRRRGRTLAGVMLEQLRRDAEEKAKAIHEEIANKARAAAFAKVEEEMREAAANVTQEGTFAETTEANAPAPETEGESGC